MSIELPNAALEPPEGWRETPLISVAEPRFSSVDKITQGSEEPVRLCNYTDVYNNNYITGDLEFMRASATQPEIHRFGLKVGDVIITKDSETPDDIGIPTVVDYEAPDLVCGYHLALIRPNQEQVDPTFLAKQLKHVRLARYFGQQANGLTRYGLPIGAVNNAPLWLPGLGEQRAVGSTLRLLDEVITKTEAVIAKLRRVRAGLLHDLLIRGLDAHGQLRDPIGRPDQFQDSYLGRIPRAWDVKLASQLCSIITKGTTPPASAFSTSERSVRYLRVDNVTFTGDLDLSVSPLFIDRATHEGLLRRSIVLEGDVLMNIVGPPLGKVSVVPAADNEWNVNQAIAVFRIRADVSPFFFSRWLLSFGAQAWFKREAKRTSGQVNLTLKMCANLPVPIPPPDEMSRIVELLRAADAVQVAEEECLKKWRALRSGLAADLVTGRVRVPETPGARP
jgi:type I restriction enzyme S subunit